MTAAPVLIDAAGLGALVDTLRARGYRVVAPVVRDGRPELAEIASAAELPAGWVDEQEPGGYRLRHTSSPAVFASHCGSQSPRQHLLPPRTTLVEERRDDGRGWSFTATDEGGEPLAFVGIHPCDVAAIRILDRVLLDGAHPDAVYGARRDGAFVVAVDCARAGETCFCASMGTGPRATDGHDLALSELVEGGHRFLAQAATQRGEELLAALPHTEAGDADLRAASDAAEAAVAGMGRRLDTEGLSSLLQASWDHPRWAEVARRCLSCGNCTLVCPTCFCTTVEEVVELSGEAARRDRRWDSCFSMGHSYIHGGSVRATTRSRYRQWMTHKLSTWIDQFGTSGCVGCGRCITWCPVGIDITEEAAAFAVDAGAVP